MRSKRTQGRSRAPVATSAGELTEHGRSRWLVVAAVGMVVFMATLDASIVTVALPVLQEDFGVGVAVSQWVILAYLLPLIAVTLPAGRWVDRVGVRAALVVTVIGFGTSSLLAGAAPNLVLLLAARAVQGTFAGASFTLLPLVINAAVPSHVRGRAMALATTLGLLGSVCGPVVGGLLTGSVGWPWIFWVNVPISLAIVVIVTRQLPAGEPMRRRPPRGMLREIALIGSASAAVLVALTLAPMYGPAWLLPGLVAPPLAWLWWRGSLSASVRAAHGPRPVRAAQAALFASSVATAGLMFLLPFYLQQQLGSTPATTGLVLLAFPAAVAAVSPLAGVIADRRGTLGVIVTGAGILALGLILVVPLSSDWTPVDLVWRLAVAGVGMGLFYGPNMTLAMTAAPQGSLGVVGATSSLVRQLGFAAGPAVVTAAWLGAGGGPSAMVLGCAVAAAAGVGVLLAGVFTRSVTSPG